MSSRSAMAVGKVWLVGAGPGDPGLLTVKGRRLLETADAVLHDALTHPGLLDYCRAGTEVRDVGKRGGRARVPQEVITRELIALARDGKRVVRLKGGDPLLFARGAEEASALREAGVPFELVPGVTSALGAAAYAGIPLTHRDFASSVTLLTASHGDGAPWAPETWRRLAETPGTLCILMGMWRLETLTQELLAGGRDAETPSAVIEWGTWPRQRVVTAQLSELPRAVRAAGLKSPALIVVGEVVRFRETLSWFDTQPLFGKRLLVLRAAAQAGPTAEAIRERGAEPLVFPVLDFAPPPDPALLERALAALETYDWVLFTSANGVERFFDALSRAGRDARALGRAEVGAIGPKTAASLGRFGIRPELVADEFVGEALAEALLARGQAPRRVLLARALEARDALPDALREAGVSVDVVPVYETRPAGEARVAELRGWLTARAVDAVLFTASSTVTNLVSLLGEDAPHLLQGTTLASIGPITTAAARRHALRVDVEATRYTVDGLLDALEEASAKGARRP